MNINVAPEDHRMIYQIQLANDNKFLAEEVLGTMENVSEELCQQWFLKAYSLGILPLNPQYTDEIRIVNTESGEIVKSWRLGWIEVEPKKSVAQ